MIKLKQSVKRLSIGAALVLLVIISVVLLRTAQFTSRQISVPPPEPLVFDVEAAAERLGRVIAFRTVSERDPEQFDAAPFLGLHEYLAEAFPRVHAALEQETVGEYSLLFTWTGTEPSRKPILLMSHLDVVPVEPGTEKEWTHPPFSGEIADGFIWGRGTLDVKSGVMALLEAVEFLLSQDFTPAQTIYLAFGHDEEVGGRNGNARIAALLEERGIQLEFILDEGGAITKGLLEGVSASVALVGVAEKGYSSVELIVEQHEGGHSSTPPPQTAVGIVAAAVHRLESEQMPARLTGATALMLDYLGPEMAFGQRVFVANRWLFGGLLKRQFAATSSGNATIRTTTAATLIEGGVQENVLPTSARAVVNFRLLPGDTIEDVLQHARRTVNDPRVRIRLIDDGHAAEASQVSDPQSAGFQALARTVRQVFPDVLVAPYLAVHATDSRHYEPITENTFRFIPARLTAADLERIHGTDERIGVENYGEIIRFFIELIRQRK